MNTERKEPRPKVGDHVIFYDPTGKPHNAVITAAWDQPTQIDYPYINLAVVSQDENKRDDYGRQIERYTSVGHGHVPGACHGYVWLWPGETPQEYRAPSSV